jgi:hypothetical protein
VSRWLTSFGVTSPIGWPGTRRRAGSRSSTTFQNVDRQDPAVSTPRRALIRQTFRCGSSSSSSARCYRDRRGQDVTALRPIDSRSPRSVRRRARAVRVREVDAARLVGRAGAVHVGPVIFEGARLPGRRSRPPVFQEFALFPWRTARGNVEFGSRSWRVPGARAARRARSASST